MESSRRFKPPWTLVRENSECYVVRDANGVPLAWLYCRDDTQRYSFGVSKLTSEEARRIGKAIARIPEFMAQRRGFHPRRVRRAVQPSRAREGHRIVGSWVWSAGRDRGDGARDRDNGKYPASHPQLLCDDARPLAPARNCIQFIARSIVPRKGRSHTRPFLAFFACIGTRRSRARLLSGNRLSG